MKARAGLAGWAGGMAASFAAGVAMTLQYRVNGALGTQLGDPAAAATISFGLGLAVLFGLVLAVPGARRGVRRLRRALAAGAPRWQAAGGLFGAFLVASQCLAAEPLGIAAFTVAVVAGQTAGGLLVDSTPLAAGGPWPVTRARMVAAGLVVTAVIALHLGSPVAVSAWLGMLVLPVLAGAGIACQHTLNGRMRGLSGDALSVALVNFLVGTAALGLVLGADLALRGPPGPLPGQPWLYLGGPLGVLYVTLIAAAVRSTGVFRLGLAVVLGQVLTAATLGIVAGATSGLAGIGMAAAATLAVLAVALAGASSRRRAGRDPLGGDHRGTRDGQRAGVGGEGELAVGEGGQDAERVGHQRPALAGPDHPPHHDPVPHVLRTQHPSTTSESGY